MGHSVYTYYTKFYQMKEEIVTWQENQVDFLASSYCLA